MLVGSAATVAIATGALLLTTTVSGRHHASLDDLPTDTAAVSPCCTIEAGLVRSAMAAIVTLEPPQAHFAETGDGVVVGNDLVATTLGALHGSTHVRTIAATGRRLEATLLASDPVTGIAVLRISPALTTPQSVSPDAVSPGGVLPGTETLTLSMRTTASNASPQPEWSRCTVTSVDHPLDPATSSAVAAITVSGTSTRVVPGEPLVDHSGHVVGILASTTSGERTFLPIALVVGVSSELAATGRVEHGWLGITVGTMAHRPGALVESVDPLGASHDLLLPGDLVVAVGGAPVTSGIELRSALYASAPGTPVSMEVLRHHHLIHQVVTLAPTP